jgi:hypothetical protein
MRFIEQIKEILQNQEVKKWFNLFLEEGRKDAQFSTFFGVNYNGDSVVSLKLYFSFFEFIPEKILEKMQFDENTNRIIYSCWSPIKKMEYSHQGLVFAVKCYTKDNEININPYLGFRSPLLSYLKPHLIQMTDLDQLNVPGICFEKNKIFTACKNYFYLSDIKTKRAVFAQFNIDVDLAEKVAQIEYTEGDQLQKMNITFSDAVTTRNFIFGKPHEELDTLCRYFFETKQWYHYAPGVRKDSDTRAVYFIPKKAHYEFYKINLVAELYDLLYFN